MLLDEKSNNSSSIQEFAKVSRLRPDDLLKTIEDSIIANSGIAMVQLESILGKVFPEDMISRSLHTFYSAFHAKIRREFASFKSKSQESVFSLHPLPYPEQRSGNLVKTLATLQAQNKEIELLIRANEQANEKMREERLLLSHQISDFTQRIDSLEHMMGSLLSFQNDISQMEDIDLSKIFRDIAISEDIPQISQQDPADLLTALPVVVPHVNDLEFLVAKLLI
ncbi:hypothetical protein BLNAU_722 [Blattamonas nauphoetae]|uniref:Uncharacterized protein n=1 Tax=Blattamonas nauphoetae TaxID=2049346 RepID=A0ABQ9YKL1_9EUKA|nr:hypothetical protein BLNAU_722 [Blattamonas nauphoetae]